MPKHPSLARNSIAGALCLFSSLDAEAASLGSRQFDSYRDMHNETHYGALFFNKDSIRYTQSRRQKRFLQITGNGDLELPSQQGYCFVFNHYDSPRYNNVPRIYSWQIVKWMGDQKKKAEPLEKRAFTPTTIATSGELPDLCISEIGGASAVEINFSSNDGEAFDRNIRFKIK